VLGGITYKVAGKGGSEAEAEAETEPTTKPLELGRVGGLDVGSGNGELGRLTLGESLGLVGAVTDT